MIVNRSADIDPTGVYRWRLDRWWGGGERVVFVMLNPSTADGSTDDRTIRRCMGFAERWGWDGITVVNLFALRARHPAALRTHPDPVGRWNAATVNAAMLIARDGTPVVAAWGSVPHPATPVEFAVRKWAYDTAEVYCLGATQDGSPRHPLYRPAATELVKWPLPTTRPGG